MRNLLFLLLFLQLWVAPANGQELTWPQPKRLPLKIAVYDAAPFGFIDNYGNYKGLMVELWEDIAKDLGWTYTYELTDMNGLLQGLQTRQYDIGLGAISITPNREALVDFTQAVNPSGTGIAVSSERARSSFHLYWRPILISLLRLIGTLLLVLILSGTIVWLVERKHEHTPSDRDIRGFADGLWWSAVTMTTVGYGDKVPHSKIGKVLGIIWIFTSIILLSLFTANASAIFTTTRIESPVQTIDDLRGLIVGTAHKSSGEEFLLRENIEHVSYNHIEEAIDALVAGKIDAVVS